MKPCTIPKIRKSLSGQQERIEMTHLFADHLSDEIVPALFTLNGQELPLNDPKSPIEDIFSPEEWISKISNAPEDVRIVRPWIDADPPNHRTTPQKIIIPDLIISLRNYHLQICYYLETQEKSIIESCLADIQTLLGEKVHPTLIVPDKPYRQALFASIQQQYLKGFPVLTSEAIIAIFKILMYENRTDIREVVLDLPILLPKWQIFLINTTASEIMEWTGFKPRPNSPSFEEITADSRNIVKYASTSITCISSSILNQNAFRKLKFGIIGMGERGIHLLKTFINVSKQKGENTIPVVAIYDHNPQAIEMAIEQERINDFLGEKCPKIYTNLENFLRDPDFLWVLIALPPPLDQNVADRVKQARKGFLIISKDILWVDPWIH